jgi:hypothetical protein
MGVVEKRRGLGFHREDEVLCECFDVSVGTGNCQDCQIRRDVRVRKKPDPILKSEDEARGKLHGAVLLDEHGLRQD